MWEPFIVRFGLKKTFNKLLEIGFDCFEIPEKYNFNNNQLKFLLKQKRRHDLFYTFHSSTPGGYINLTSTNIRYFKLRAKTCLERAKGFEAEIVTFDIDPYSVERSRALILRGMAHLNLLYERLHSTIVENIKIINRYAKQLGILVAIENPDIRDVNLIKELKVGIRLDEFKRITSDVSDISITLDIGHLYSASSYFKFDMFRFIEDLSGRIVHTHIHDNFGREDGTGFKSPLYGDLHLPPGLGTLPLEGVIERLKKNNYSGSYLLEIKPFWITDEESKIWKLVEDSYKRLKKLI